MQKTYQAGTSVQGRPIEVVEIRPAASGDPHQWLLLMGAVHGDEHEGIWLLGEATRRWKVGTGLQHTGVVIVECVNPDGAHANTRTNARGVDLNRNLPTSDWSPEFGKESNNPGQSPASEPETRMVIELLEKYKPVAIISIHSMKKFQINSNGPARDWSMKLAEVCQYPVTDDIGYPCPGSFGTYAGAEKQIPTITLEVERGLDQTRVLEIHTPVLDAAVRYWDERCPACSPPG